MPKGITVNHNTGEYYTDEEDSSGVQVSSGSQGDYTDESEEEDDAEDDEWDSCGDYIDEIQPSDSASRPQVKRHVVPAPAAPAPRAPRPKVSHRASSRHAVPVSDPPSRQRSHSRTTLDPEHRPRRRRRQSVHADSLEDQDDYPYAPSARTPAPPGHPSQGWGHIPQAPAPNAYAPSLMSDPRFHGYPGGAQSPAGQLVPFGHDPYYAPQQNPFAPNGQNPFTGPPPPGRDPNGYFPEYQDPRQGRRGHRNSMPPPPQGEMMPFSPMGYYPPYGAPYGMPGMPMYPPYGHPQHPSPPPQHPPSKRPTPKPQHHEEEPQAAPPPPPPPPPPSHTPGAMQMQMQPLQHMQMPMMPPPPPPPDPKEDGMLTKLEKLLLNKAEDDEKAAEAARKAAEEAKFARLENLLISQQEARIEKDKAKKQAAEDAAKAAADAKKKGDEDKLAKLEKLILAQKDEQLKREAAADAARAAEKAAADAEAAKVAADKKAAAESAKLLLDAAQKAREEAEKKAAADAEETKKAHEKALAEAKAAAEELEKGKKAAEEEAAKLKPSDAPKAPIKFKDAVGRKFSFPWHLCKTWKVCNIPKLFFDSNANMTIRAWKNSSNKPSSTLMLLAPTSTKAIMTSLVPTVRSSCHKYGKPWYSLTGPSPCTCGPCLSLHQRRSHRETSLSHLRHQTQQHSWPRICPWARARAPKGTRVESVSPVTTLMLSKCLLCLPAPRPSRRWHASSPPLPWCLWWWHASSSTTACSRRRGRWWWWWLWRIVITQEVGPESVLQVGCWRQ
ncbi:hypothetical protein N0V83_005308 [Neocucurbitaria cava]|uniref:Ubiquitin-like domain-containing protein n=1 Tax=Neocucurbitaria cava TaxID=798079 RepID=A0A9W8Y8A1_9PLEO|nr:hypothetical protein N0V83_005308 [Neocucurbitaria cava]